MSHFTVMVIGDDPEEQLKPYNESIEVPPYTKKQVTEEDIVEFIAYYQSAFKELKLDSTVTIIDGKVSGNFDELYKKHGKAWNDSTWRKHTDDTWWEYSTYNPNSKWDWYELGGRWTGFFKARKGAKIKAGRPGLMTDPAKPGYADSLKKRDIDFDSMYNEAADEAGKQYDTVMAVLGSLPPNKSWDEMSTGINWSCEDRTAIEAARKEYSEQPRVKAYREEFIHMAAKEKKKNAVAYFHPMGSPDIYLISRDEFVGRAMKNTVVTFAIVKDGKWYERGEMGWWGMVSNEKDKDVWLDQVYKLLGELSDDTLISVYDCHI